MTSIVGVVDVKDYTEALKELEDLKYAKKQRDIIYDFLLKRGFDVPGTTDQVVIGTIRSLDHQVTQLDRLLHAHQVETDDRIKHLGDQINQLSKFLGHRGWNLDHGGGAVDIAIGIIKQLDEQLRLTQSVRVAVLSEDYGQELERLYPPKELRNNLTCEDVGCRCTETGLVDPIPLEECADCRSGCYNCARHGGGV